MTIIDTHSHLGHQTRAILQAEAEIAQQRATW